MPLTYGDRRVCGCLSDVLIVLLLLLLLPLPEYVQLYVDFLLNKSICKQFAAFYHGFHSVCASDALMVSWVIHSHFVRVMRNSHFTQFTLTICTRVAHIHSGDTSHAPTMRV